MSEHIGDRDLTEKRITVMGLGRFGGGVGAIQFLLDRGARVTLTDLLAEEELADSLGEIERSALEAVHLGGHAEEDFLDADLIVVNPAVPRDNEFLDIACQAGVPLTSEMNLFWQFNRGRVIGVTGSNGKSTTTALIHSILQSADIPCRLGGNIGQSLLPVVDEIEPDEWVVLELSSFQLHDLNRLFTSPQVAVVTNFSPNHLDWHGSLSEYREAKQAILRWQTPNSLAVLNQNDSDVSQWATNDRTLWFGLEDAGRNGVFHDSSAAIVRIDNTERRLPISDWLELPGEHNLQNALAAICVATAVGADESAIQQGIENFEPLPHRLQFVGEVDGRRFYNDSLATTPESMISAVASFSEPVVLLAGGYDKLVDLSAMASAIVRKTKAVALLGQTAEMLSDLIDDCDTEHRRRECVTFEEAFDWVCGESQAGDVVLLSPGCASYDWFPNFAKRGERFAELVEQRKALPANTCRESPLPRWKTQVDSSGPLRG